MAGEFDLNALLDRGQRTLSSVLNAATSGEPLDTTNQIALAALGVALAAAALQPRLDVEMRRASGQDGLLVQRVAQLTTVFLFAGLMNIAGVLAGIVGPANSEGGFALSVIGFLLYGWAYFYFIVRVDVLDRIAKKKAALALNPTSTRASVTKPLLAVLWIVLTVAGLATALIIALVRNGG